MSKTVFCVLCLLVGTLTPTVWGQATSISEFALCSQVPIDLYLDEWNITV